VNRVRVKVCCISSVLEAELAIAHGADALGLVGDMPSGPGVIDDDLAREIAAWIPPGVETFLLTSRDSADAIADHVAYCGTTTVQIVQHIDPREYPRLISSLPGVRRVQVIHIEDASALELTDAYRAFVHAFLLDSGRPNAPVAELGGTGRAHDWEISAEFVRRAGKPVFLAGGLNPGNVRTAIDTVSPFGVDVCSGVRSAGRLEPERLAAFTERVWGGGPA
jgi:phosphoribosylanthranilate isomerase